MPWLKKMHDKYSRSGLVMVGVHTPEFFYERGARAVARETDELQLPFPQMVDPDGRYWEATGNRAWPSVFLVDKVGIIRARYTGTIYPGDSRGEAIDADIAALLAE